MPDYWFVKLCQDDQLFTDPEKGVQQHAFGYPAAPPPGKPKVPGQVTANDPLLVKVISLMYPRHIRCRLTLS